MKNNLLKGAIALSIVTSSLMAGGNAGSESSARLDALGLNVYQTADNYNIWANPAFLNSNGSQATINVRGQNTRGVMAGASVKTGGGTIGVYFGRPSVNNTNNMASAVNTVGFTAAGAIANPTPANQLDLMYSIGLNDAMDLGFRFSHKGTDNGGTATAGVVSTTTEEYSTEWEFEGGILLKELGLDVSLAIGMPFYEESVTAPAASTSIKDKGAMFWTLQGGFNIALDESSQIRVNALLGNDFLDSEVTNIIAGATTTETRKDTSFLMGGTATYSSMLTEEVQLFLNTGLIYASSVQELTNLTPQTGKAESYTLNVPVVGSIEAAVNEEWTVRSGASVTGLMLYNGQKTEIVGTSSSDTNPTSPMSVNMNIGFGYAPTKDINVDGVVSQGVLFGGGNLLSGLTSKITASYSF